MNRHEASKPVMTLPTQRCKTGRRPTCLMQQDVSWRALQCARATTNTGEQRCDWTKGQNISSDYGGGELKHWIKYVAPDGLMVEEFQSKPGGKTSRNRRSFGRTRLRMAKEASNFQSNLTNLRLFKRGKKSKEITFYAKRFM